MAASEDREPFRVLLMSAAFEPGFRGGGVIRSVVRVVDTASADTAVTVVTRDRDVGDRQPYPGLSGRWVGRNRGRVFYLAVGKAAQWVRLWRQLRGTTFDLLYLNSLWQPWFTVVPALAVRLGLIHARTVLLAPRGELSPGAFALKGWKKKTFLRWWGPFLRRMHVRWHASTVDEAAHVRALFPWARVEVALDQVRLPDEPTPTPSRPDGPARLVFISRISPKKNLDLALTALNGVSGPVEFDIYGPAEDTRYLARCQALIGQLPPHVQVRYLGELSAELVRQTFSRYDAFLFPTLGENFGHVIGESLSASCPVVCSGETPWSSVLASGGGAVVSPLTEAGLRLEIERITAMTPAERLAASRDAGDAYRSWRSGVDDRNILDHLRVISAAPPSPRSVHARHARAPESS